MFNAEKEVLKIVNWIRETVTSTNAKGVVLGLSGGVDSAVVALLCKRAFPHDTLCLMMPCYSDGLDEEHALLAARIHDLEVNKIELDSIYDIFRKEINSTSQDSKFALGNIKARLRMITLNYYAAKRGYLVVGPTNKSEFTIGYFTKHGDSGVDIMPIADYLKKDVYELAKFLKVPEEIIKKIPTAGLWEGQTDENEMKMSYEQLDSYIAWGSAENNIKDRIEMMMGRSEHKRNFPKIYKRKLI